MNETREMDTSVEETQCNVYWNADVEKSQTKKQLKVTMYRNIFFNAKTVNL